MTSSHSFTVQLDRLLDQIMASERIGGLAVAVTDRQDVVHVACRGYANLDAQTPVSSDTLFDIGSVGKSFTAVSVMQQVDAGRLNLHAPVTDYLPWFRIGSPFGPITPHHLLSHTAGLVNSTDASPSTRYEVWALHRTPTLFAPGERWHYSNAGYKVLGVLLEEMLHQPYREIVRHGILDRLGMVGAQAAITHALRPRLAVGYRYLYDDRPPRRDDPLVPVTWLETEMGDGSIAASVVELAAFVRMLLNGGAGPARRIVSEPAFTQMTRPVEEIWPGLYYAYGVASTTVEGHRHLQHRGGALGISSAFTADMDEGLGAVVFSNGPGGDAMGLAHAILHLLRDGRAGQEPTTAVLPAGDSIVIADAAAYGGTYRSRSAAFTLSHRDGALLLGDGTGQVVLEPRGPDTFFVDHPAFSRFLLRFGRDQGTVVEAFHGSDWYTNDRYIGPVAFDYPAMWDAYTGHYRSYNPFLSNVRIFVRKGGLVISYPYPFDVEEPLVPLDGETFRIGEGRIGRMLTFDAVVGGKALRLLLDGDAYYRFFTD